MIKSITNYMCLPETNSVFEEQYLTRMNRIAMWFYIAHVPILSLLAFFNETGAMMALVLTTLAVSGPVLAVKSLKSQRSISVIMGVAAMFMGGLLVHFGQGPVQIEMHFYFFVLLALLAVFANPMVIVAAAVTAALHHALLWFFLPASVFNYDAPFWVVGVHAAFVILESVAACFIARSFFDNVIGLERKVAERTEEVVRRNNDMRRILDTVEQGLLTIDSSGRMSAEKSAATSRLLGPSGENETLFDLVRRHDSTAADWLELGLDDVFADIMPIETTIDQLPKRISVTGKTLELHFSPIMNGGQLDSLALVVSDISAEVERELLEAENRELISLIENISKDKYAFLEFFEESESLVNGLKEDREQDLLVVKRRIHTLKGNAAIFGLGRIARICHDIETGIEEEGLAVDGPLWTKLFGAWAGVRGNLRRLVHDESFQVQLSDDDLDKLLLSILNESSKEELATQVVSWMLEPTHVRLTRLADNAKRLASRLGKGNILVRINSNGLRTDSQHWSHFWSSLTHVIRNAVDHGIESPEDRRIRGKSEAGSMTIRTTVENDRYIVSVADDGCGIAWDRVRAVAEKRGIKADTHDDLVEALFVDGLSTSEGVTETSGRGVGMSAVREITKAMGGQIEVDSQVGNGTEFRFCFPADSMAPKSFELLLDYGVVNPARAVIRA